jgi:hypothetical protein
MKNTYKHIILSSVLMFTTAAAAQSFSFVEPAAPSQSASETKQTDAYNAGQQALNESKWDVAAGKFEEAARIGGSRTAAALYWKAYSEYKLGQKDAAIRSALQVTKDHPQSKYAKDANALLIEMGHLRPGQVVDKDPNEDLKLMALRQICSDDDNRCAPLVRKFIENPNNSARAKEQAMFVMVQSDSAEARQLVGDIARGKLYPALQVKAIQNLGVEGTEANLAILSEIYAGAGDVNVKKKILESFGVAGASQRLLAAAKSETNPELQKKAVQGLGVAGAGKELRDLYKQVNDQNMKIYILEGLMVASDDETLAEIARSESDQKVRLKAIHMVGVAGGKRVGATLLAIWNANSDYETRKAVSEALFVSGDSTTLITLAKAEKDPQMKRRLVEKIALMGDKASKDYMIQILEQE